MIYLILRKRKFYKDLNMFYNMEQSSLCNMELRKLREENEDLKEALAIALNKPLLKQLKNAIKEIETGEYYTEEEFAKHFNLTSD